MTFKLLEDVMTKDGIGRTTEFDEDADGTVKVTFSSGAFAWYQLSDLRKVV